VANARPDVSDAGIQVGLGVQVQERAGAGPTIKSRARLMVGIAFVLTLPALLLGVVRASDAGNDARVFLRAEHVSAEAFSAQRYVLQVRVALWAFEAQPGVDSGRRLAASLDDLARALIELERELRSLQADSAFMSELESWREGIGEGPLTAGEAPLKHMRSATGRVRQSIDPEIRRVKTTAPRSAALRRAHAALDTLDNDSRALTRRAGGLVQGRAHDAESAINLVGRDIIVLFLFLLFSAPVVLAIGPPWMIAPLVRLRGLAQRIKSGHAREINVSGHDEVAEVGRGLKSALARLESQDHKQRAKIFEMRRVVRAAIAKVSDPVLIVGRQGKVDYANAATATLLGRELHHIESAPIDEVLFSPGLTSAIDDARTGDLPAEGIEVQIETEDERVETVNAELESVRSQDGQVSRVVVVLHR